MTELIDVTKVDRQSSDNIVPERPPRRYGQWLLPASILVAGICTAHALAGAFSPVVLSQIDAALVHIVAALKVFGIRNIAPGLDGPLDHQFYVNNNGICVWGVMLNVFATIIAGIRGNLPLRRSTKALQALMRTHGWTANRAWLSIKIRTLAVALPFVGICGLLFFNGLFGWVVFQMQPKDWLGMSMFTLLFFYLPGTLLAPLTLIVAIVPLLSLRYASQHLAAK